MAEKRRLNTATLGKNAIWYSEEVQVIPASYPQASLVAEGLLDFKRILSQTSFSKLGQDSQMVVDKHYKLSKIPECASRSAIGKDGYEEKYQVAAHEARFDLALRIAKTSRDIVSAKEARWSAVVKYELFENLIRSSRQEEGVRLFDPKRYVERVRVEEEDVWEHGRRCLRRTAPPGAPPLTAPKADLYIALPIFSKDLRATGFRKDDYIQNFTQDNLTSLEESKNGNLISNPITPMYKMKDITEKHLVCFPSTVVEIKHHNVKGSEIRKCYDQAANASATALSMLGRLSHLSIPSHAVGEIQPVVAFTFIGNKFRVWVTYICNKSNASKTNKMLFEYAMRCIFKGNLKCVWDTVRLCCIIERVHHWTIRHFRPWVSSCLSRWRWAASEDINREITWIGEMADLKKQDKELSSNEDRTPAEDSLKIYNEESDDDDDDDDGEEEYEPSDEEGISLSEEEDGIETEEETERDFLPIIQSTPSQRRASRQDRSEEDTEDSPSRSKGTPTRVMPHRDAKTVSPEALVKTGVPLFASKSDSLTLSIREGKSHARSRSTGNIKDL